ncbi:MAG: aldo/keto reductase [Pirellulaceae bacterium]
MQRRRIGRSALVVSDISLGTMTFGSSCDETEAFRIMDRALNAGIDLFDTAEIYPVPPEAKWVHRTEEIVGKWLAGQSRDKLVIATKVCGSASGWFVPPVRDGHTALDRVHIMRAIEGSLRRLRTDYVDLYQTHWPDHDFPYEETLEALDQLVRQGKVRAIGSSNETAWGAMKAQAVAESLGTARYESIQNNFSIVNRRFEDSLAEVCRREQISLLPYSPIGGGVLTGKYNSDSPPAEARFSLYRSHGGERQKAMADRFVNAKSLAVTEGIVKLAQELGISAAALSVAWSRQHDFVASTILGANTVDQLEESLQAIGVELPAEVMQRIDQLTKEHLYPLG